MLGGSFFDFDQVSHYLHLHHNILIRPFLHDHRHVNAIKPFLKPAIHACLTYSRQYSATLRTPITVFAFQQIFWSKPWAINITIIIGLTPFLFQPPLFGASIGPALHHFEPEIDIPLVSGRLVPTKFIMLSYCELKYFYKQV